MSENLFAPRWLPRRPRCLNRAYAFLFGYFWLPCPLCGFHYGGHEWGFGRWIPGKLGGLGVCFNHTSAELELVRILQAEIGIKS